MIEVLYLLPVVLMLGMLLSGIPVAISLAFSGSLGLLMFVGLTPMLSMLETVPHAETGVYSMSVLPMFILMAQFVSVSGLASDIFEAGQRWLAHIPGGLAIATTITNGGFAALSGSSLASAATMSKIAVPEMRKQGYQDKLSIGTVTCSGTFAILLPPSIALIVYGLWTDTSIGNLFLSGIIPALITLFAYIITIVAWLQINPDVGGEIRSYSWKERASATQKVWPVLVIFALVIAGIYSGAVTVIEAGAVGAASSLFVTIAFYGARQSEVIEATYETADVTARIFLIIIGATLFARYLTLTGLTQQIITAITTLPLGQLGITVAVLLFIIFLGAFINQIAIMLITLPIIYPLFVNEFGYSAIWLGIVMIKAGEIGLVTPPLGMNIFVATSVTDVSIDDAFRGATPFILMDLVILGLFIAFPGITTILV